MERGRQTPSGFARRRKPRWGLIALIVAAHVLVLVGLARALAPDFTASVIERATALVTVTVETTETEPNPEPSPQPDEGAAAEEGRKATPRETTAPRVLLPPAVPVPRASSTGAENSSGARERGSGTGAGGEGDGTGSGRSGSGTGGVAVTKPIKIAGDINSAADYPTPPGGREIRDGQFVEIYMTVGTDGRASNCHVAKPSIDPVADRITCELAVERFRFQPAHDANGNPVTAEYGWRQRWFRR